MKAWILSDLHCDHGTVPPPVPPDADIAGDVCNPHGYPGENAAFDPALIVEI